MPTKTDCFSDHGDFDALLSSLYTQHYSHMREFAQSQGCSYELAEDLVQETFEAVLQNPGKLLSSTNHQAWLLGILKNRIRNSMRSARYARLLQSQLEQTYVGIGTDELKLATLYSGCMRAEKLNLLIRIFAEGCTSKELAEELGISPETCRKRIQRARKEFRSLLEEIDHF